MRRPFLLITLSLGMSMPVAVIASPIDIGVGVESFNWQSADAVGGTSVKETGPRLYISVEGENQVSERWTYGFRGKIYSGTAKNTTPLDTDIDYDGVRALIDFTGRFLKSDGDYSNWGLRLGIGGEGWRRHVPGATGQTEKYSVIFGTLGVALQSQQGWFGEAGGKYPFSVREKIDLYDGASLSPQGAFSFFATVGYNFNQRWSVRGYYDSYRFKESATTSLTNGGVPAATIYQPNSDMSLLGIGVGFYF